MYPRQKIAQKKYVQPQFPFFRHIFAMLSHCKGGRKLSHTQKLKQRNRGLNAQNFNLPYAQIIPIPVQAASNFA